MLQSISSPDVSDIVVDALLVEEPGASVVAVCTSESELGPSVALDPLVPGPEHAGAARSAEISATATPRRDAFPGGHKHRRLKDIMVWSSS